MDASFLIYLIVPLGVIAANVALILRIKTDMKLSSLKEELRKESKQDVKCLETEIRALREELRKDFREFHGRICAIEERNRR